MRKPSNLIFLENRKGSEKHSLKEDNRPIVHEKVLNPTDHQGNVSQNHRDHRTPARVPIIKRKI